MSLHLFHQNMRAFGGGDTRIGYNDRMGQAFYDIKIANVTDYIVAAGFTEIKNNKTAAKALKTMVRFLDIGLTDVRTVAVGRTAALKGRSVAITSKKRKDHEYPQEYVTMVAANGPGCTFEIESWGKSIYTKDTYDRVSATCYPVVKGGLYDWELPFNAALDTRGIGYLVGVIRKPGDPLNGRRLIVCFMHNMYGNGDRYGGFTNMPMLTTAIYAKHGLNPDTVPCIVGGDMNVAPRRTGGGRRGLGFEPKGAKDQYNKYIVTTDCSAYDWWACHVNSLAGVSALIHLETRKKSGPDPLSDHAGISISLTGGLWWP